MNAIQPSLIEQLCSMYDLGTPIGVPSSVQGGLLHRMWRLETTHGVFALKQLNPAIMRKPGIHDSYRLAERIAADFARRGLPSISALSPGANPLAQLDQDAFLVYEWVEGTTLAPEAANATQARLMGALLARLHAQQLNYPEQPPLTWGHFDDEHWDMLTFQAADQGLPWAYPVRALLPNLHEWSRRYEEAGETLLRTLVISHCDLDQKNVLWRTPLTPCLIDWEAAGPINPTMELVGLAQDWCGPASGAAQTEIFAATIEGYVENGGKIHDPGLTALHGVMGRWLGWLLFNMRRSLGESVANEEERQLGIRETGGTLGTLRSMISKLEIWAGWTDKWR
jgi:thiamine kinase-like enzyme